MNWVSIGSGNGLPSVRHQAITWINAGLLLIALLGTNFKEIRVTILSFSFKKMHLKLLSAKMGAILFRWRWVKLWHCTVIINIESHRIYYTFTHLSGWRISTFWGKKIETNDAWKQNLACRRFIKHFDKYTRHLSEEPKKILKYMLSSCIASVGVKNWRRKQLEPKKKWFTLKTYTCVHHGTIITCSVIPQYCIQRKNTAWCSHNMVHFLQKSLQ